MAANTQNFEGTRAAFNDLVSRRNWYKGITVNGTPLLPANAYQIKIRLKDKSSRRITQDYMEDILKAAGYRIVQPVIWQK